MCVDPSLSSYQLTCLTQKQEIVWPVPVPTQQQLDLDWRVNQYTILLVAEQQQQQQQQTCE